MRNIMFILMLLHTLALDWPGFEIGKYKSEKYKIVFNFILSLPPLVG